MKSQYRIERSLITRARGIFGVSHEASHYYACLHLAIVFCNPYRDYFAIFRSRDSTATSRTWMTWTVFSTSGKFITCSYLLKYVLRNLFTKIILLYHSSVMKMHKIYFMNNMTIWWTTHEWCYHTMAGRWDHGKKNRSLEGSICMGKYYLGHNNKCRQSSCAVNYSIP